MLHKQALSEHDAPLCRAIWNNRPFFWRPTPTPSIMPNALARWLSAKLSQVVSWATPRSRFLVDSGFALPGEIIPLISVNNSP